MPSNACWSAGAILVPSNFVGEDLRWRRRRLSRAERTRPRLARGQEEAAAIHVGTVGNEVLPHPGNPSASASNGWGKLAANSDASAPSGPVWRLLSSSPE